jgi:hypothetical protein
MAAGTADGRLYLGFGGQPPSSGHGKKKTRQWGGLRASDELMISVAEGPIVAMSVTFFHPSGIRSSWHFQGIFRAQHPDNFHSPWKNNTISCLSGRSKAGITTGARMVDEYQDGF